MYIKCWGSRGSIPVSGKDYIKYGGDTSCVEIRTDSDDIIIVDAGTGIRRLGDHLLEEKRHKYNLILTHAHWDHLMGFPFFKPLFIENSEIHMHRGSFGKSYMVNNFSRVMAPPNFPVRYSSVTANIIYEKGYDGEFEIGSVKVIPIPISHPNGGKGYKFVENGKTFIFLTDNELGFNHNGGMKKKKYIDFCTGADLLIHDAEYTPKEYKEYTEYGHSSYTDALDLAIKADVESFGLFHLNQDRRDQDVDEIVKTCRETIDQKNKKLNCFAVGANRSFEI